MAKVPDELLQGVDWNKVFRRLVVYAHRKLGARASLAQAEDLAADAVQRFFDPKYANWDPEHCPSLDWHLGSIVNGILRNRVRRKSTTHEMPHDLTSSPAVLAAVCPDQSPESRSSNGSDARRALELLEHELKGDEYGEGVLLCELDEISEPRDQAEALGVPITTVYKARHRLGQARGAVRDRMRGEVKQ